jgi:hypothetical protein
MPDESGSAQHRVLFMFAAAPLPEILSLFFSKNETPLVMRI